MNPEPFFAYARERYHVFLNKAAGQPKPWTNDEILQRYRFCNIFREDDKVTIWFKENMREELRDSKDVIWATILFRCFNRISTGEILKKHQLHHHWDPELVWKVLKDHHPLVTGAYMVRTPHGVKPKLQGMIDILNPIWEDLPNLYAEWNMFGMDVDHKKLMRYNYIGAFVAYEIVTDLRHTLQLEHAYDKESWANPGPGAARGLSRLMGKGVDYYKRTKSIDYQLMVWAMRDLLDMSRDDKFWPANWPHWEMREVEHTLCEWDKYERVRLGEGAPKQKYEGAG